MLFTWLVWVVTLVNGSAALAFLFRPIMRTPRPAGPIPIRLADMMVAATIIAGLAMVESLLVARSIFGIIHLVYLQLVVPAPLVGIVILLAGFVRRNRQRRFAVAMGPRWVALCSLLAIPVGIWASFVEPFRIRRETPTLQLRPARGWGEPLTVAVLADIQTDRVGAHEHRAVDLVMQQSPDLILLPGDLWQGPAEISADESAELKRLLNRLSAPGGVYFVRGNCESGRFIERYLDGTPVRLLTNQVVRVHVRDRDVAIGGVELNLTPQAAATVRRLEDEPGDAEIRILMAHYPDHIRTLRADSRIDLLVAGHTHGGQIVIPGWGPPLTLSHVPREVAAGGLHVLDGNAIYVSRGIGCERGQAPRIRLFCPPEVTLIRMEPSRRENPATTVSAAPMQEPGCNAPA